MNVEFNNERQNNYNYSPQKSGLANLVIKMGLAKDESGAQKVMIVLAIIFFALSIYFFIKGF